MKIRNFLKILIPPIFIYIIRFLYDKFPKYFGLNNLDRKIEKYVDYDSGFFVELGANNGINQSNTLYFEKYRNWKGVLIEPTPNNFLECRKNRKITTEIFCNACVSFDYKQNFVELAYCDLMTTTTSFGNELNFESHVQNGKKFLKQNEVVFKFGAIPKTLTELLKLSNAPNLIDFLSLDVEGAEFDVLNGIDFSIFNFKYICIETNNFEKINHFLNSKNYTFLKKLSYHDYLFEFNIIY